MRTPGLLLFLGLALIFVDACREEKPRAAQKPGPEPAGKATRTAVKAKILPYTAGKEDSYVRRAVQAWADRRARAAASSGGQPSFAVLLVDSEGGSGHRIVVREEVRRGKECSATLSRLKLPWADPSSERDPAPTAIQLGQDCCAGKCDRRPPVGWQVELLVALHLKNLSALRDLVDPKHGVRLVIDRDDEDNTQQTNRVYRRPAFTEKIMNDISVTVADDLSCSEPAECPVRLAEGCFACTARGGAYQGSFVWRRDGPRAYLVRLAEERQ